MSIPTERAPGGPGSHRAHAYRGVHGGRRPMHATHLAAHPLTDWPARPTRHLRAGPLARALYLATLAVAQNIRSVGRSSPDTPARRSR
jgi:hypothetical protein